MLANPIPGYHAHVLLSLYITHQCICFDVVNYSTHYEVQLNLQCTLLLGTPHLISAHFLPVDI